MNPLHLWIILMMIWSWSIPSLTTHQIQSKWLENQRKWMARKNRTGPFILTNFHVCHNLQSRMSPYFVFEKTQIIFDVKWKNVNLVEKKECVEWHSYFLPDKLLHDLIFCDDMSLYTQSMHITKIYEIVLKTISTSIWIYMCVQIIVLYSI